MCVCVEESRLQPQLLFLLFVWSFQWIFSDTQQFPTRKENRLLVRRDNYVKLFSKAMGLDVPLLGFVYVRGEEMRRVFQNWNTQQNEVRIDGGLQTVEETEESTSCRVSLGLKWTRQHGVLKEDCRRHYGYSWWRGMYSNQKANVSMPGFSCLHTDLSLGKISNTNGCTGVWQVKIKCDMNGWMWPEVQQCVST